MKHETTENALFEGLASLPVQLAFTALGLVTPIGAFLPVLGNSPAAKRSEQRIFQAFCELNAELETMKDEIKNLTDEQYTIILNLASTILQTTSERKLQYLRLAIKNTIPKDDFQSTNTAMLARIIRDISADEILFLLKNFSHQAIAFVTWNDPERTFQIPDHFFRVDTDTPDGSIARSLLTLGLLEDYQNKNNGDQYQILNFSPITAKVISLFHEA